VPVNTLAFKPCMADLPATSTVARELPALRQRLIDSSTNFSASGIFAAAGFTEWDIQEALMAAEAHLASNLQRKLCKDERFALTDASSSSVPPKALNSSSSPSGSPMPIAGALSSSGPATPPRKSSVTDVSMDTKSPADVKSPDPKRSRPSLEDLAQPELKEEMSSPPPFPFPSVPPFPFAEAEIAVAQHSGAAEALALSSPSCRHRAKAKGPSVAAALAKGQAKAKAAPAVPKALAGKAKAKAKAKAAPVPLPVAYLAKLIIVCI
jgi:hypothetical protein